MADVRSLLRQERASRQQTAKPARQSAAPAALPASKKRKAVPQSPEERKRTRTEPAKGVPAGFFDGGAAEVEDGSSESITNGAQDQNVQQDDLDTPPVEREAAPIPSEPAPPALDQADLDELDAFMNELDEVPIEEQRPNAYASGAVLEAAPMTAAELAAEAKEEQRAQRARRDEEVEAEKEDAARQLEDEFDEMEKYEDRVQRLREQREALRKQRTQTKAIDVKPPPESASMEAEDSESDEDEDWDDWRFNPSG